MTQYDNTNRGQIWGNDKKEKDTHPDFKGTINVEGVEYWLSAWKRKPDANPKAPALSFSIQKKDMNAAEPARQAARETISTEAADLKGTGNHDFDDDIPFNRYEFKAIV